MEEPALVLDCGWHTIKAGLCGEEEPRVVLSTGADDEVMALEPTYGLGATTEVAPHTEERWARAFGSAEGLAVDPSGRHLFTSHPVGLRKQELFRCAQLAFERFDVQGYYTTLSAQLMLYAAGKSFGTVIDCGHQSIRIVPIYEGTPMEQCTKSLEYGGLAATRELLQRLNASPWRTWRQFSEADQEDLNLVDRMKLAVGHVLTNPTSLPQLREANRKLVSQWRTLHREVTDGSSYLDCLPREIVEKVWNRVLLSNQDVGKPYRLPDGSEIWIGEEAYACSEPIFDHGSSLHPERGSSTGLVALLDSAISLGSGADEWNQAVYWRNITVAGGGCQFNGFKSRLHDECTKTLKEDGRLDKLRLNVSFLSQPGFADWVGSSILGSLGDMRISVSKQEYQEQGPAVMLKLQI